MTGAAIGALAGVVGAFLMVRFQNALMNATVNGGATNGGATADVPKHREPGHPERKEHADASAEVAEKAVHLVAGKHLDREQRKRGGEVVHYAFGAGAGALYGAVASLTAEDAEDAEEEQGQLRLRRAWEHEGHEGPRRTRRSTPARRRLDDRGAHRVRRGSFVTVVFNLSAVAVAVPLRPLRFNLLRFARRRTEPP